MSTRIGQRRLVRTVIPVVSAVLIAAAVGAIGVRLFHQSHAAAAGVAVAGNRLTLEGAPFVPLGFTMVGLLSPPGCNDGVGVAARNHLNQNEMNVAKNDWHANTLRFQISYNGLTGYTADQRAQYLQQIEDAVTLSRKNGFVVILSLQDQGVGCGPARPLPPQAANGVWTTLADDFQDNPYVLFELWNEPTNQPNNTAALGWPEWLNGTTANITSSDWAAYTPTGHQNLVNTIRKTGATNVIMADGANHSEHLEGIPLLSDPLKPEQIAYAPHMYYFETSKADWNSRFGYLAATKPVVITEWNMKCDDPAQANMQPDFFNYLTTNHVGLTAWGLDFMDTLINDWSYTPTSAANCGNKNPATNAGGAVTKAYFTNYKANPSPTPTPPAPTPTPPTPTPTPPAPVPAPPPPPPTILGDVNGDKRVNAIDLSSLLSHDGQNYPAADFNHDGTVGAADLAILLAHWTW